MSRNRPDPGYPSEKARQRAITLRLLLLAGALAGIVIGLLARSPAPRGSLRTAGA